VWDGDYSNDGVHPSESGAEFWAKNLIKSVIPDFKFTIHVDKYKFK